MTEEEKKERFTNVVNYILKKMKEEEKKEKEKNSDNLLKKVE
jgi:hypothetical protein